MLDARDNNQRKNKEMELSLRALGYLTELRELGRATTAEEVRLVQKFRWSVRDGAWVIIDHCAAEPVWYPVSPELRGELGEKILVTEEGYFRRTHEWAWEKLRVDRNTRHFGTKRCPARVPSYRFANWLGETTSHGDEDPDHAVQYLRSVSMHDANAECESCTALLDDYLFGMPYQGTKYTQGLFTKLNRMAARGQRIHAGTVNRAMISILGDKRRTWRSSGSGFARPELLASTHGYTDPRDAAIIHQMALACGYEEPASWQSTVTKIVDFGFLTLYSAEMSAAEGRAEVLRRVETMRNTDAWFEESLYQVLMERDARFNQLSMDDAVHGEDGSRTYAETLSLGGQWPDQDHTIEEVCHMIKDFFYEAMNAYPTEKPRDLMRRALLGVERRIDEPGFAYGMWSDTEQGPLLWTLARQWWMEGQEQARQLGLGR